MTHADASSGGGGQGDDDYLYSDHLYVDRPEEKFACPICLCPVQRVAHLTGCCGNHFCFKCISRVRNANKSCPTCNAAPPVHIFPNKERQREINQLRVQCPLNTEDAQECDWRGELGSAKRHILESHCRKDQQDEETKLSANLQEQCHIGNSREPERPERTYHSAVHHICVHCTQPVSVQCSVSLSTPNPPTLNPDTLNPDTLTVDTPDTSSTHSPPPLHTHLHSQSLPTHPPHHPPPHHPPPHHPPPHHPPPHHPPPHHPPPYHPPPHHPPPHHLHHFHFHHPPPRHPHPHHPHPHHPCLYHPHPHHPYPHHHLHPHHPHPHHRPHPHHPHHHPHRPHPHHFPHRPPHGCKPHH